MSGPTDLRSIASLPLIIADDDAGTRALLVRQLERAGYDVTAFDNGAPVLPAIREQQYGVIIADWNMPGCNGIDLCHQVRTMNEEGEIGFAYILLLTANSDREMIIAGLDAGADDYLTKPYHPKELLARVRAGERIMQLQLKLLDRQVQLTNLNIELERLANTDPLTALANRRSLFTLLERQWSLATRHNRPLTCLMFDIDRFKLVNDTHGHHAGDAVLRGVAETLRSVCRKEDLAGRFGGEEFCVVASETTVPGMLTLAERLRLAIEARVFEYEGSRIPVTVSIGVCGRHAGHADAEAMIGDADRMLYKAKENGRNQTWYCTADQLDGQRVDATLVEA